MVGAVIWHDDTMGIAALHPSYELHPASPFRGGPKDGTSDVQLHIGESRDSGFDASHRPGMTVRAMTVVANAYRAPYLPCYKAQMSRDRQIIAPRVVLDDRSRLPWRFFGRLTTAALAA